MSILITLAVVALIIWLIFTYLVPQFPAPANTIIGVILAIILIVYLLHLAGVSI